MSDMSVTHVPDLKGKLKYLLHVRGGDMPGWNHRVTNHKLLAMALSEMGTNTDEPTVSRWKPHENIPNLVHVASKIGTIFRCDEQSFRRDDLVTFIERTEGTAPSWSTLVATAEVVGTINPKPGQTQAARPTLRPMVAYPVDMDRDTNEQTPRLEPGSLLEAILPTPAVKRSTGSEDPLHVLLFSGDSEGYLNWLPRARNSKAFKGLAVISSKVKEIRFPSFGGEIKIDPLSHGRHDIVLVVSMEELPMALQTALEAKVENAGLPALMDLGRWLAPRLHDDRAAICHRPYLVGKA